MGGSMNVLSMSRDGWPAPVLWGYQHKGYGCTLWQVAVHPGVSEAASLPTGSEALEG